MRARRSEPSSGSGWSCCRAPPEGVASDSGRIMIWRAADPFGSAVLALVERIWRPFPRITRPPLASAVRQCLLWPASSRHDTVASVATLRCRLLQLPFSVSAAPRSFARRRCCQHRSTPSQVASVAVFRFPARPAPSQGDTVSRVALLRCGSCQLPLPVSGAPESCANGAESRIFFRVVHSFASAG